MGAPKLRLGISRITPSLEADEPHLMLEPDEDLIAYILTLKTRQ